MVELFIRRLFHFEAVPNTPENADRIRELTALDPVTLPPEYIVPFCVETQRADPVCSSQAEFDERYQPDPEAAS